MRPRFRMRRAHAIVASCWLACTASCFGSSSTPRPDAGNPAGDDAQVEAGPVQDATIEASTEATVPPAEAGTDASADAPVEAAVDSAVDAPPETSVEAGAPVVLLIAVDFSNDVVGASYTSGTWSPVSNLGSDAFGPGGGGVAVLSNGQGLGVVRGNENTSFESATWAGTWSAVTDQTSSEVNLIGLPVVTATGAAIPFEDGITNYPLLVDEFTASTSTWAMNESTPSTNDNVTTPALALTLAGDLLLLSADTSSEYTWSLRDGATWGTPTAIVGLTPPSSGGPFGPGPGIVATALVGVDQVVAVFVTSAGTGMASVLQSATFSAGAWSSPAAVAADVPAEAYVASMALAPLPDGRAALAYVTSTGAVNVGFWSGAAWSTFQAVPAITASTETEVPAIAIARGATGAQIELVCIDGNFHLQHARLVDEAAWTWTTPFAVDGTGTYGMVSIAVGP